MTNTPPTYEITNCFRIGAVSGELSDAEAGTTRRMLMPSVGFESETGCSEGSCLPEPSRMPVSRRCGIEHRPQWAFGSAGAASSGNSRPLLERLVAEWAQQEVRNVHRLLSRMGKLLLDPERNADQLAREGVWWGPLIPYAPGSRGIFEVFELQLLGDADDDPSPDGADWILTEDGRKRPFRIVEEAARRRRYWSGRQRVGGGRGALRDGAAETPEPNREGRPGLC